LRFKSRFDPYSPKLLSTRTTVACSTLALGENWPQWRGPYLDGTSGEKNLPGVWSKTENVSWRLPMPSRSGSTPIIRGERIFLNGADGDNLELWRLRREPLLYNGSPMSRFFTA